MRRQVQDIVTRVAAARGGLAAAGQGEVRRNGTRKRESNWRYMIDSLESTR
jgi:hypothetical protein